jgi:acid phosphatase
LINFFGLDIAFELFKNPAEQSSRALDKSKTESTTPVAVTGNYTAQKGWYERIFGGNKLVSINGDKSSPVGMARQKIESLNEGDRATLDGYYVRIRYNDKVMKIPGCKAAGKHLDGDESFCTLVSNLNVLET